jgi:hypothetical protein
VLVADLGPDRPLEIRKLLCVSEMVNREDETREEMIANGY